MKIRGLVSRDLLCQELDLGEGTITLLKHLKMHDIIKSTIARTKLTCISVRFEYEWRDADNPSQWMRTHGNEHWEFDDNGLMRVRDMSAMIILFKNQRDVIDICCLHYISMMIENLDAIAYISLCLSVYLSTSISLCLLIDYNSY
jgi:hypothetical protein